MSSDEILKILITFDDFLKLANLGADIGRNILFGIARFFLMDCAKFRKHNDRNVDLLRFL